MKRIYWIAILLIFLLFLYPIIFPRVSRTYEFPNPLEEIISIEFLINKNESGEAEEDKLIFKKSLSEKEIARFMSEIYKLETRRCYPPMWGWGEYIAKVTYSNGDVEMLGSGNIEYVESGASATGDGPYAFWEYGTFEEVFLRYSD